MHIIIVSENIYVCIFFNACLYYKNIFIYTYYKFNISAFNCQYMIYIPTYKFSDTKHKIFRKSYS